MARKNTGVRPATWYPAVVPVQYWVKCRMSKFAFRNKKLSKQCDGLRDAGPEFGSLWRQVFFSSPPLQDRHWSAANLLHKPTNKLFVPRNKEVIGSASCRLWRPSIIHTSCPEESRTVLWDVAWQTCTHDSKSRQNWPDKHCINIFLFLDRVLSNMWRLTNKCTELYTSLFTRWLPEDDIVLSKHVGAIV
jgi:hypothetical protein